MNCEITQLLPFTDWNDVQKTIHMLVFTCSLLLAQYEHIRDMKDEEPLTVHAERQLTVLTVAYAT